LLFCALKDVLTKSSRHLRYSLLLARLSSRGKLASSEGGDLIIRSENKYCQNFLVNKRSSFLNHTRFLRKTQTRRQVFNLREHHRSRVVPYFSSPQKHFFKAQSSSSTMRAAIIFVALGAVAVNAGVLATETDTLSATTTVTIFSCHPTVTNCPVSPLSPRFPPALRVVYFRDISWRK
jgi:hypothetical protein